MMMDGLSVWDWVIIFFRVAGAIGAFCLTLELMRIFLILEHPRLRIIAYKIMIFFGIFGGLKLIATGIDTLFLPENLAGAIVNSLLVYWLLWFFRIRRKRLYAITEISESRHNIADGIIAVLDEMKSAHARIERSIKT